MISKKAIHINKRCCCAEPRYFVFQNLFQESDIGYCDKKEVNDLNKSNNRFNFESYPLLKLKIKPFEGYIAPIERILHEFRCQARVIKIF